MMFATIAVAALAAHQAEAAAKPPPPVLIAPPPIIRVTPPPILMAPPAPPAPPPPVSPRVRRTAPLVPLVRLFSADDYPAAALRAEHQGMVSYRLTVGRDGRVAACAITGSSGSPHLDSVTCRILTARARFVPARDARGRPTIDHVSGRVLWRIPEPPPPPLPPGAKG